MINILFFIDTTLASGGAEKVLRELVNNMNQEKFAITVHTLWKEDAPKYLNSNIRYRYIFTRKNRLNQLLFRVFTALGITYSVFLKDLYDIEIAYLENGPTKVLAKSTNKRALKLAWVHCDLSKMVSDIQAYVSKTKPWYKQFDKVVCVSEYVQKQFISLYGNSIDSLVLHNTLDETIIRQKALSTLPHNFVHRKKTVVTVGRLYHQKGYDRLLEAHRILVNDGFDCDLWILGEGPERYALQSYIDSHKLNDSVFLLGFQANPYPFMREADIVVCSSYYEGYSTMVTEALILGKPVVTTPCSGMEELLGNSQYGLITQDSVQGIYEGMKYMLDYPEQRKLYAAKAAARGKAFSKADVINETQQFFISSLAQKRNL